MTQQIISQYKQHPLKIDELEFLENELKDVIENEYSFSWNAQRSCIEHHFNDDDFDLSYTVLSHWAEHSGARVDFNESMSDKGDVLAYIYL